MNKMDDLYNSLTMPGTTDKQLLNIQEKLANGCELTLQEKIKLPGHDHPVKKIGDYECKSYCCYRTVSKEVYEFYKETGFIEDLRVNAHDDIVKKDSDGIIYTTNGGINWYLGGVGLRYGGIVIECPALKKYFTPAIDNGTHLVSDPTIRHMKSSPKNNPIPMSIVTNVFDLTNELDTTKKR
jgi:hypothetical protein